MTNFQDYENFLMDWWDNKEPSDDYDCRAGDPDDGCNCPNCQDAGEYITEEYEGDEDE